VTRSTSRLPCRHSILSWPDTSVYVRNIRCFNARLPFSGARLTACRLLQVDRTLSGRQKMYARYVSELSLQAYAFLQHRASHVAAACVCLAKLVVPNGPGRLVDADAWPQILAAQSRCSLNDLIPCIHLLNNLAASDRHPLDVRALLPAVREKFASTRVSCSLLLRAFVQLLAQPSLDVFVSIVVLAYSHPGASSRRP